MTLQIDTQALLRAQRGLEPDRTRLLEAIYGIVKRHLGFWFGFSEPHDDVLQECMLEIYRALPAFRGEASIQTWALSIASRTARRAMRKHRHAPRVTVSGELPELSYAVDFESREGLKRLLIALEQITPKKREAFVLIEIMGCSAKEAGQILGTFANTAASRSRHAKEELNTLLGSREIVVAEGQPVLTNFPGVAHL